MAVTESLVVDGDEIAAGFGVFEPPPLKRGAGRPTAYDAQIADQICDRVADGEFIHVICADPGFPKHRTVRDWTQRYTEFKSAYEQAKHCKHERLMDECLQIADAATKMHACRLMVMDAARKQDLGQDVRVEASMIKVYATEMATEVLDHAMQTFGAMGVTKELPLHLMAQRARVMRVYEGPSEVHRMSIAKKILKDTR